MANLPGSGFSSGHSDLPCWNGAQAVGGWMLYGRSGACLHGLRGLWEHQSILMGSASPGDLGNADGDLGEAGAL